MLAMTMVRSFAAACACLVSLGGGFVSSVAAAPAGPVQVAAPEKPKIVATLHAKNLEVTLGLVRDYLPVPVKPEVALFEMFGELSGQVLLSAPAALVVGVDAAAQTGDEPSPPLVAFSIGVRSLDEVQKRAQGRGMITGGKPGASLLQIQGPGRSLFCLLTPGSIAGSGRLSCARKEHERDVLGPYLARLPAPTQTSDLHGELSVDTLVAAYEGPWQRLLQVVSLVAPQKLKLGNPAFDRALTDVLQALVNQLQAMSRDVQSIAVDLTLQKTGIELRLAHRLVGQTSWWAQSESDGGPGGAPPIFFSLPEGSMAASFQQSDPKWAKQVLDLIVPLLDGYLSHDGMAAADRQAISDVVNKALTLSGGKPLQMVMATGKGPDQATAADGGLDPMAILSGNYYLVATEGASDQTVPWLKSIVAMYNRPGVQTYLRTRWKKLDPTGAPPTLKADPLPKGLPAGGYGLVLSGSFSALSRVASANRPASKGRPLTLHLLTVPGSGRLWSALGGDKAALGQRLVEAMGQPAKTVAQKNGIEALREPGLRGGGFTSLVAMSSYLDALILATSRKNAGPGAPQRVSAGQLFTLSPHHGEVPMIYMTRRGPSESSGRTSEFIVRVPRMVIEDIAALAMQLALEK